MDPLIVAEQPRAAEVGARILAQGGNAFDAAIATAFCQTVIDPFRCGIGGMGSCQYYVAATGEHGTLSFHTRAGSGVSPGMWEHLYVGKTEISGYTIMKDDLSQLGYTAIMTPGVIAGLGALHEKLATLDWSRLLLPAIEMQRNGFRLPARVAAWYSGKPTAGNVSGRSQLTATPTMKETWLKPDGSFYQENEIFHNDSLVRTLERIAENGPDDFYRGSLAKEIADDFEKNGAFVTADDLAAYEPVWASPVHTRYRGFDVYSQPPPASGVTTLQILNFLEGFELGAEDFGTARYLNILASAMKWAHHDRDRWLGDPEFVDVPVGKLLDKGYADKVQHRIREGQLPEAGVDWSDDSTTQVTVRDADGNTITMTHTLVACSGVITPGLGFIYNNSMKLAGVGPDGPNALAPRKARTVGMSPSIVFHDGQLRLAIGAPGGSVIISSVSQTILNVLEFGMTAVEAVSAPRIHCEGGKVFLEYRMLAHVAAELERLGHVVDHRPSSYDRRFSRPQLVVVGADGRVEGASDPRSDGGIAMTVRNGQPHLRAGNR